MSGVIQSLAGIVVVLAGMFLIGLALSMMFAKRRAERFLSRFASSARTHYLEQPLRLIAGLGFVFYQSQMKFPIVFHVFGWVLVVTAIALFLVPWRWHHRYAQLAIPWAMSHIKLYGLSAFGFGGFVLWAVF